MNTNNSNCGQILTEGDEKMQPSPSLPELCDRMHGVADSMHCLADQLGKDGLELSTADRSLINVALGHVAGVVLEEARYSIMVGDKRNALDSLASAERWIHMMQ